MNNKLLELNKFLENINPNSWESIPDIDLYIDQVLDYMKRQHPGLNLNESLTSSMVNNYAKQGLMPRAKGKKYNKEHISCLTIICLLKQIISVSDTKTILNGTLQDENYETLYKNYTELFQREAEKIRSSIDQAINDQEDENSENSIETYKVIMELAINSYLYKLACQYLLNSLEEGDEKNDKHEK